MPLEIVKSSKRSFAISLLFSTLMTSVCQKCGVRGDANLLVFCSKCQMCAEHRYCLDQKTDYEEQEVYWLCEQCDTRVHKVDTFDGINVRRKKGAMRHHYHLNNCADFLEQIKDRHLQSARIESASPDVGKPRNGASHGLDKDVLNEEYSNLIEDDISLSSEKNDVHPEEGKYECLGNEIEGRQIKKRRKLILDDDSDEDSASLVPADGFTDCVPFRSTTQLSNPAMRSPSPQEDGCSTAQPDNTLPESASECYSCLSVRPIVHRVWRGYFNICDGEYGPVVAHLSNNSCEKVRNAAEKLPQVLYFDKLPRLDAWPKRFKCCAPTDVDIGVYFFPKDARTKAVLEQLLDDMIKKDLALKVILDEAELLMYASILLPQHCHLFDGVHYLWGVFRPRQASALSVPPVTCYPRSSEAARPADERQHQHRHVLEAATAIDFSNINYESERNIDKTAFREAPAAGAFGGSESSKAPGCEVSGLGRLKGEDEDELLRTEGSRPGLSLDGSPDFAQVVDVPAEMRKDGTHVEFSVRGEYESDVDGSLASCLTLFPLGVEDLGVVAKIRDYDEVDLELGLEVVRERKYERQPAVEKHTVLLFGRPIF